MSKAKSKAKAATPSKTKIPKLKKTATAGITTIHLPILMHGITGRMGKNQHLNRSILAIRDQGGVKLSDTEIIMPEPTLVGRSEARMKAVSDEFGGLPYSTDLDGLLADEAFPIFFDASLTSLHYKNLKRAINSGKHVYSEKPVCETVKEAQDLHQLATKAGVHAGTVQDKLWLPGLLKLKHLIDTDFFGDILSVRGEFGYWVFTGHNRPAQRPSWNYRKEDGGGIIVDMLCHWRYVIDNLFGNVKEVSCLGATHIPERIDEKGKKYKATSDDAAYATFITEKGIICNFNSSWCVRVRRDDLLTIQVDGTRGSAVAGLRKCWTQHDANVPKPVWNPDIAQPIDFYDGWTEMPDMENYDNAFKIQWELFMKAVVTGGSFPWNMQQGAKGVQLAQLGIESWEKKKWLSVPDI